MSEEEESPPVRVNFGRPMALFPLDEVVLFPNGVAPLHIFEPRYRQMVGDALDGAGQFAMAVFEGERWREEYHGRPPLRPVVCVAHIVKHERLADGRYNILIQGVCRARIVEEAPGSAERLYREATLAPVGSQDEENAAEVGLGSARTRLSELLSEPPLTGFSDAQGNSLAEALAGYLEREDIPTTVAIDLIAQWMVKEPRVRYALLAEGDPERRAATAVRELEHVRSLLLRAERQRDPKAPKGVRWN